MNKEIKTFNSVRETRSRENEITNLIVNQEIIEKRKYFENKGIKKEIDNPNIIEERVFECVNDYINSIEEEEINKNEELRTFKDGNEIFEFIVSSEKYKNVFKEEIHKIIQFMNDIIYTPPYPILFGRINISKLKPKEIKYPFQKEINELFYEGFELDEFK
ncbi:hypothetical protein M9Y10_023797 [Tritrichomonas musculus]|uniref:Uncharacterized protein n=1 Tax=Tritrichomonas musculus TaxID=1915356 RepID=A0ABR2KXZ7_9EUKA